MKSLGRKPYGLRLERMRSSPLWAGDGFRNIHPVLPGLRDAGAAPLSLSEFLCGGERRVPTQRHCLLAIRAKFWAKATT